MPATAEFVTTTSEELLVRIGEAHARFAEVARAAPADALVDDTWSVRDVVAHLANVVDRYVAFRPERLAATARGVDDINARELDDVAHLSIAELLHQLAASIEVMMPMFGALPLDMRVNFHGGTTIDVQAVLTNAMAEFLVHGLDIANAVGKEWPIADTDGSLLLGFGTQILPSYVKSTSTGCVAALIEADGGPPWLMALEGPTCTSRAAIDDDATDLVIRESAANIALAFYGRIELADAGAQSFIDRFERP